MDKAGKVKWLIGFDLGFGNTKIVFSSASALKQQKPPQKIAFPTSIAETSPDFTFQNPLKNFSTETYLEFEGKKYVIGKKAQTEPGCFQLYDIHDLLTYAPLILKFTLIQLEIKEKDYSKVMVCMGLPPGWWNEYKNNFAKRLKETLNVKPLIIPQGIGAFWLVKNEIQPGMNVLLLDIGYYTVDYLYLIREEESPYFRTQHWGTLAGFGVTKLEELFKAELKVRGRNLPERVIRNALQEGRVKIYGTEKNFEEERRRAIEKYNRVLVQRLKGLVGNFVVEAEAVVFTGGGVYYFRPEENFRYEGEIIIACKEAPEFGNAMGQFQILIEEFC